MFRCRRRISEKRALLRPSLPVLTSPKGLIFFFVSSFDEEEKLKYLDKGTYTTYHYVVIFLTAAAGTCVVGGGVIAAPKTTIALLQTEDDDYYYSFYRVSHQPARIWSVTTAMNTARYDYMLRHSGGSPALPPPK